MTCHVSQFVSPEWRLVSLWHDQAAALLYAHARNCLKRGSQVTFDDANDSNVNFSLPQQLLVLQVNMHVSCTVNGSANCQGSVSSRTFCQEAVQTCS